MENEAISILKSLEGFSEYPYFDVNKYRWGYGTPVNNMYGPKINEQEAHNELMNWINALELELKKNDIFYKMNRRQRDAYLMHAYNTGGSYGLLKEIEKKMNFEQNELEHVWKGTYITSSGKILNSLKKRREIEYKYFIGETMPEVLTIMVVMVILFKFLKK